MSELETAATTNLAALAGIVTTAVVAGFAVYFIRLAARRVKGGVSAGS